MIAEQLKKLSLLALLLANVLPIIGVIYLSWSLTVIMMLFWLENLVIGVYAIIKIFISRGSQPLSGILFTALFFTVHYGLFWSIHGVFLASLLDIEVVDSVSILPAPLMMGADVVQTVWPDYPQELTFGLFALIISHGFSLFDNFIRKGEYKLRKSGSMPVEPYRRVFLLHITLILGAIIIDYFGHHLVLLVLLVLAKVVLDARFHIKEHNIHASLQP